SGYMMSGVGAYFPESQPTDGPEVPPELADLASLLPPREFEEGRRRLVLHQRVERTRCVGLIKEAKRVAGEQGRLRCEVCRFDFRATYGERGTGFIEGHHKVPLSQLEG